MLRSDVTMSVVQLYRARAIEQFSGIVMSISLWGCGTNCWVAMHTMDACLSMATICMHVILHVTCNK